MFEKSYHKSNFLKNVSKKLNLNTKIFQKNIFEEKNIEREQLLQQEHLNLCQLILDLVDKNFKNIKI